MTTGMGTAVFSLLGPLPTGHIAIEASAGTGKTYTLAGLATRYVAERGVRLDELLMVTFTRAAAAELRERVRSRLGEAAAGLRDPSGIAPGDELLAMLAAADRDIRLARLERAVAEFDTATITTIHGFAQQVLATLGSAAPGDVDAKLLNDTNELVRAVCADELAKSSIANPQFAADLPKLEGLQSLCTRVLSNPGIELIPSADAADSTPEAAKTRWLVDTVVDEVHRRRRAAGTLSFDDLLTQLRDALRHASTTTALRRRFRIALIDEFQDTDLVQWEIFSRLFEDQDGDSALVLVADPKQAIYAFRGADVHTYLEAAHAPGTVRSTLKVNRRSDGALLESLGRLFAGATFGDAEIGLVPVEPSPEHKNLRLLTSDGAALSAMQIRLVSGEHLEHGRRGAIPTDKAQDAIARDLALQIQELLNTAWIPSQEPPATTRRLRPSDIAVLIGRHNEAEPIVKALRHRQIPSVLTRGDSVLRSAAATQWRYLLTALAKPADPTRARAAALSWFFGWTPAELDSADDAKLSQVHDQLFEWADTLENHGIVDLCAHIWAGTSVIEHVLASSDGDRNITDLEHIAGLIIASGASRAMTASGLLTTLDQLEPESDSDPENKPTTRQVESEAEAVQIMTVHAAKGLEFPVTCVPTLWRATQLKADSIVFQDPESGLRTFDVAGGQPWPNKASAIQRKGLAAAEELGENLRLVYVALTRAKHQTLVWWAEALGSGTTGLAHVLFARRDGAIDPGLFAEAKVALPAYDQTLRDLRKLFAGLGDAVVVGPTDEPGATPGPWVDTAERSPSGHLGVSVLERPPERLHRRWSFSAISGHSRDADIDPGDESLGDSGAADEPDELPAGPPDPTSPDGTFCEARPPSSDLPLGTTPGGKEFGTLVHEVLRRVDFSAIDLEGQMETEVAEQLALHPWPASAQSLAAGLLATVHTPLGALFQGRALCDFTRSERLDELNFELHLGDDGRYATDRDLGSVMLAHLPGNDPLRPWAQRLAAGLFSVKLAGHLTGSIDMVVRVRDTTEAGSPARFVVVDYKTNVLGDHGRYPQMADYHPERLGAAMAQHHYPLQALLYSVALHRYLRWRVRDYNPNEHFGGIAYLFVRGMAGPATPVVDSNPHGVFTWRAPIALITSLSDLLYSGKVPQ